MMEKLKERITENGIDYILIGDYYIPDLKLPEENRPIGRYGRLHLDYLKQEHPAQYSSLTLTGKLWTYLADLNADERNSLLTVRTEDGDVFEIVCRQAAGKEDGWMDDRKLTRSLSGLNWACLLPVLQSWLP